MVFQFSSQGNPTVINFSVVHQTSSQTLSLPPRREVEVYLWGTSSLYNPWHTRLQFCCCTLGLQVGAGSCSCCRGRSCTIQGAASGFVIGKQIKCLRLCLVTSITCHQMWAVLAAAVLRDSSSGWTGGCFGTEEAAAHKSCNTFSALLRSHQPSCVGHAATTSLGCRPCAEPGCFLSWT